MIRNRREGSDNSMASDSSGRILLLRYKTKYIKRHTESEILRTLRLVQEPAQTGHAKCLSPVKKLKE